MVNFGDMYIVASDVQSIRPFNTIEPTYPYGIELKLKGGSAYTMKYPTKALRDQAVSRLTKAIDYETEKYERKIFESLGRLEFCFSQIETRQLRLHRVLKGKLSPDSLIE